MMSQFSFVAISDFVQDGVGSVKRLSQRRLHSAPPALQLRPIAEDIPGATQRLWGGGEPISCLRSLAGVWGRVESGMTDLHELADGKQISQGDVVATEERLPAEEHCLQLVQRVVQLSQRATQTLLVHLGASLPGDQHLRHTHIHTQAEFPCWFFTE